VAQREHQGIGVDRHSKKTSRPGAGRVGKRRRIRVCCRAASSRGRGCLSQPVVEGRSLTFANCKKNLYETVGSGTAVVGNELTEPNVCSLLHNGLNLVQQ
jgi:hypothetical protein